MSNKFNAKCVGADSISAQEKGITLIALIITIIVMLILVGVTINVALNGGLFEKSKGAKNDTIREMDREELYSAVVASYDAKTNTITRSELVKNLGEEWTVSDGDAPWTCTSKKNGNSFIVDSKGNITDVPVNKPGNDDPEDDDPEVGTVPDSLYDYIVGKDGLSEEDGTGRSFLSIINPSTMEFIKDPEDAESKVHEDVKLARKKSGAFYIRYQRQVYKIEVNAAYSVTGLTPVEYKVKGNLGKYVKYNNLDWIILSEDKNNNTVELISAKALLVEDKGVELGYTTPEAIEAVPDGSEDIDGDGNLNYERARYAYNNVIDILDKRAREACGIEDTNIPVRNIGGNTPNNRQDTALSDKNTIVFSEVDGFEFRNTVTDDKIAKFQGATYGLRNENENYKNDWEKMEYIGVCASDDVNDVYWISSRSIRTSRGANTLAVDFRVKGYSIAEDLSSTVVCDVYDDLHCTAAGSYRGVQMKVRPIITLPNSLLDRASSGNGSLNNPLIISE